MNTKTNCVGVKWQPFFFIGCLIAIPFYGAFLKALGVNYFIVNSLSIEYLLHALLMLMMLPLVLCLLTGVFTTLVIALSCIGITFADKAFWYPMFTNQPKQGGEVYLRALRIKGYKQMDVTRKHVLRWVIKGLAVIITFFVWTGWKHLLTACVKIICSYFMILQVFGKCFYESVTCTD